MISENKTLQIFIELGGENHLTRERSNTLIAEIIKNSSNPNFEDIKIILSGKASFDFYPQTTEAEDMKKYIQSQVQIPNECFILEKQAIDTLGNIYFSSIILLNILNNLQIKKYSNVQINIITQEFHMRRVKHFFEQIFNRWVFKIPVKYNYIKAHSKFGLIEKLKKSALDYVIQKAIDLDFFELKINSFQDFENYLFSLPIYNKHYKAKLPLTNKSAYATAILKHTQNQN